MREEGGQEKSEKWGRGAEGIREPCTLISEMRWEGRGAWCSQAREQPLRSPRAASSGPWARSTRPTAAFTSLLISAAGQVRGRTEKGSPNSPALAHHAYPCPSLFPAGSESHLPPMASNFLQSTSEKLGQPPPLPGPYL